MMKTVVEGIANWASELRIENIPPAVVDSAKRCLVDTVAVSVPGAATPVAENARRVALAAFAPGQSALIGDRRCLTAPGAALANATAAHALDFDDNCYAGVVHGSAVVIPAALSVAQEVDCSGSELITAIVAGVEAEYAIGKAATLSIYERGLFTSALLGVGGAAVSAARALRLDAEATAHALGLAMSGAGGVKACLGTDAKPLLLGQASQAGVLAARLAQAGATGPSDVFENERGFAQLFGQGIFNESAINELGDRWSLIDPGIDFKLAPVCLSAAAALDGLMEIISEQGLTEAKIDKVVCELSPISRANLRYDEPRSIQEAQFSLPFVLACALRFGEVTLDRLDDSLIADPEFKARMKRIEATLSERFQNNPELADRYPEGAFLTIRCTDGHSIQRFIGAGRGTAERPLTDEQLETKFYGCTACFVDRKNANSLLRRLKAIQHQSSVRDLLSFPKIVSVPGLTC